MKSEVWLIPDRDQIKCEILYNVIKLPEIELIEDGFTYKMPNIRYLNEAAVLAFTECVSSMEQGRDAAEVVINPDPYHIYSLEVLAGIVSRTLLDFRLSAESRCEEEDDKEPKDGGKRLEVEIPLFFGIKTCDTGESVTMEVRYRQDTAKSVREFIGGKDKYSYTGLCKKILLDDLERLEHYFQAKAGGIF